VKNNYKVLKLLFGSAVGAEDAGNAVTSPSKLGEIWPKLKQI